MTNRRAREQLRQERLAFEQAKCHGARWFMLRLSMGYSALILMAIIATIAGTVILNPERYSTTVVGIAATTLLIDMLALVGSIFRLVLQQGSAAPLLPVTTAGPEEHQDV